MYVSIIVDNIKLARYMNFQYNRRMNIGFQPAKRLDSRVHDLFVDCIYICITLLYNLFWRKHYNKHSLFFSVIFLSIKNIERWVFSSHLYTVIENTLNISFDRFLYMINRMYLYINDFSLFLLNDNHFIITEVRSSWYISV